MNTFSIDNTFVQLASCTLPLTLFLLSLEFKDLCCLVFFVILGGVLLSHQEVKLVEFVCGGNTNCLCWVSRDFDWDRASFEGYRCVFLAGSITVMGTYSISLFAGSFLSPTRLRSRSIFNFEVFS